MPGPERDDLPEDDTTAERDARDARELRVSRTVHIPLGELTWRFTGSGGPGGQHANTSNTRVEVVFDIGRSPALHKWDRARLLQELGPTVRVVAADTRSQSRNRELALERLQRRLAAALRENRARRPTAPTRSSQRNRVDRKRAHSKVKQLRRKPSDED